MNNNILSSGCLCVLLVLARASQLSASGENWDVFSRLDTSSSGLSTCQSSQFQCSILDCIPYKNVCNGVDDCPDGRDETKKSCWDRIHRNPSGPLNIGNHSPASLIMSYEPPSGCLGFECDDGKCLSQSARCDGLRDCTEGSDEVGCPKVETNPAPPKRCPSGSFKCDKGKCIRKSERCDGFPDCTDGSDEVGFSEAETTSAPPKRRPVGPGPSAEYCSLPQQPQNGHYVSRCLSGDQSAACRNVPGTAVSPPWVLKYSCNHNYSLSSEYHQDSICDNGTWVPSLSCVKLCPPLKSLSADVECFYNGREVSCDGPMRPNTSATAKCKEHYHQNYEPQNLLCQESGEWNMKLQYCRPLCGVSTPQGSLQPLILHGNETKRGEFPWLAAIYHQSQSKLWEHKCGGTLITPHIVLTGAHCVVVGGNTLLADNVKVGLGKYYRDYYTYENDSVIADVREIATPPHYSGPADKYTLDIALLDLVHSVQINSFVMPACVDWNSHYVQPISFQTVGYVAGWGRTENLTPSEKILSTQLTFINNVECKKKYSESYYFIVHDKFCAGSNNGSQVLKGDSGGGFTVVKSQLHYVLGVVSVKVITSAEFSMFTDIKNVEHSKWMDQERKHFRTYHHDDE